MSCSYVVKQKPRDGDWVCSVCSNLNFSFRNQCNRCLKYPRRKRNSQFCGFKTIVLIQYEDFTDTIEEDYKETWIDPAVQASLVSLDLF
ncbi:hypothetical protein pb186bvf_010778 [Paramecium bursaria]